MAWWSEGALTCSEEDEYEFGALHARVMLVEVLAEVQNNERRRLARWRNEVRAWPRLDGVRGCEYQWQEQQVLRGLMVFCGHPSLCLASPIRNFPRADS